MSTTERKILDWVASGETGESSRALACFLAGAFSRNRRHPLDPADFNRCLKMLKAVPELRPRLAEAKALSPEWSALIDRWEEIEKAFVDDVGWDWSRGQRASKTYALMKEILAAPAPPMRRSETMTKKRRRRIRRYQACPVCPCWCLRVEENGRVCRHTPGIGWVDRFTPRDICPGSGRKILDAITTRSPGGAK